MSTKHLRSRNRSDSRAYSAVYLYSGQPASVPGKPRGCDNPRQCDEHGVNREEAVVPGVDQDVRCLLYTPKGEKSGGGYLHIHGGGYIGGQVEMSELLNTMIGR